MPDLQTRLANLITAIGADIKRLSQTSTVASSAIPTPIGSAINNSFSVTALARPQHLEILLVHQLTAID